MNRFRFYVCHAPVPPGCFFCSCFIIHQSFEMRINSITSVLFAPYLLLLLLRYLAWIGCPTGLSLQTYKQITFTPSTNTTVWFQLSVFDFCSLHSIFSFQGAGAKYRFTRTLILNISAFSFGETYPSTYKPKKQVGCAKL